MLNLRVLIPASLLLFLCFAVSPAKSKSPDIPQKPLQPVRTLLCDQASRQDADPLLCGRLANAGDDDDPQIAIAPPVSVDLQVNSGTPLRIALDRRTRVTHVGEEVHGKVVETVYAFDQPVIPAGSEATGHVSEVTPASAKERTFAIVNGNFAPIHKYAVTFESVTLPNGQILPIHTTASVGMDRPVRLGSHDEEDESKAGKRKNVIVQSATEITRETKEKLHEAVSEISSPGKMQRLKKFALSQLPYRQQYLEEGTRFNAPLEDPLDFGQIQRRREELAFVGNVPEPGSRLHARLIFGVSSATASRGNPVAAVLTEPLYSADHHLVLPADSLIIGQVLKARPAHKLHRNGELRLIFERIETPDGQMQSMQGSLEGVEVDKSAHVKLDEEGGAHGADSKTRYLTTGIAIAMAAAAAHPDAEHGTTDAAGDPTVRAGAGGSAFGLTGSAVSLIAKSTPVSVAFGAYGAGVALYSNFISRGHDVVLPKDTQVEIGFGPPHASSFPPDKKQK